MDMFTLWQLTELCSGFPSPWTGLTTPKVETTYTFPYYPIHLELSTQILVARSRSSLNAGLSEQTQKKCHLSFISLIFQSIPQNWRHSEPRIYHCHDVTRGTILIPHVTWSMPEAPTYWERERKGAKSQSIFWSIRMYTDAHPPLTVPQPLTILLLLTTVPWSGLAHLYTDTTRFAPSEIGLCPSLAQVSIFLRKAQFSKTKMQYFFFFFN